MSAMRILGVDLGAASGAYAILDDRLSPTLAVVADMPVADGTVNAAEWNRLLTELAPDIVVAEIVGSFPKQGVASSFKFGKAVGLTLGIVAGRGVSLVLIAPSKWKKALGLNSDKEKARARAIQLYPSVLGLARKKDHNRAEALLLAHWLRESRS